MIKLTRTSKRKKLIRVSIVFITILLMFTSLNTGFATAPEYGTSAILLYELGVLTGSDKGFELERAPTRLEGLIILIKLLGEANNISNYSGWSAPFDDVPDWGKDWVTYAYNEGLTTGVGSGQFGSNDLMQAESYMTFLLKALEYDPNIGDFSWETSLEKAHEIGMISLEEKIGLETQPFLRDHVAYLSEKALMQYLKDQSVTLAEHLVFNRAIERQSAEKVGIISKKRNRFAGQIICGTA